MDELLTKAQEVPAIGQYNIDHVPEYVRQKPEMAVFASLQERFQDPNPYEKTDVVTEDNPIPEKRPIIPQKTTQPPAKKTESIPTVPKQPPLKNVENADKYETPAPGAYNLEAERLLPAAENKIVPVTGGSSLTKYLHKSPWALSGERFAEEEKSGPRMVVPPDKYERLIQQQQQKADQTVYNVELSPPTEFVAPVELINVQTGIGAKMSKKLDEMNRTMEIRQQRERQKLLNQKLHPSIGPEHQPDFSQRDPGSFFNSALLDTPNPQSYQLIQQPQQSSNPYAEHQKNLQQYSNLDKWKPEAPSIPLVEKMYIAKSMPAKPPRRGVLELQPLRKTDLGGKRDANLNFSNPKLPKQKSKMATCAFKNTQQRMKNAKLEEMEREVVLKEQQRHKMAILETQMRQVGGVETVVNYQLAKGVEPKEFYNGTAVTQDQVRAIRQDTNVDFYQLPPKERKPQTINQHERVMFSEQPKLEQIVQAGPGSKKAVQIIAENRLQALVIGPGTYNAIKQPIKKSYNALSEENKIE